MGFPSCHSNAKTSGPYIQSYQWHIYTLVVLLVISIQSLNGLACLHKITSIITNKIKVKQMNLMRIPMLENFLYTIHTILYHFLMPSDFKGPNAWQALSSFSFLYSHLTKDREEEDWLQQRHQSIMSALQNSSE